MFDEDERMFLFSPCIRCGTHFISNPNTVPSVWINTATWCPVRPDGSAIEPGEPGTTREPLCPTCVPIIRAAVDKSQPLLELFPLARIDRITPKEPSNDPP